MKFISSCNSEKNVSYPTFIRGPNSLPTWLSLLNRLRLLSKVTSYRVLASMNRILQDIVCSCLKCRCELSTKFMIFFFFHTVCVIVWRRRHFFTYSKREKIHPKTGSRYPFLGYNILSNPTNWSGGRWKFIFLRSKFPEWIHSFEASAVNEDLLSWSRVICTWQEFK